MADHVLDSTPDDLADRSLVSQPLGQHRLGDRWWQAHVEFQPLDRPVVYRAP